MLTVRIDWATKEFPLRSGYTCEKYTVDQLNEDSIRLLLDDGKHDILIGGKAEAFIMNDHAATVDIIRLPR